MKDLVTYLQKTELSRNGESPAEEAWKKMLAKGNTRFINNFIKVARTDKDITDDPGNCLLSTVKDYNRNPIIEIYAWDNYKVHVFSFSQEGADYFIYDDKGRDFIEDIKTTHSDKAFYINDSIAKKWCVQINKIANK